MNEVDIYQSLSERRSPAFKGMVKRLIILGTGAIVGLAVFSIGMAWVKNPNVMVWLLWGLWIYGLAWSFSKVHHYKNENYLLQSKVDELQNMIWDRLRPAPAIPITSSTVSNDPERNMNDIIDDITVNLDQYSYYDLMDIKKKYPQSGKLRDLILNWSKFWTRHPERDKTKTRSQLK